MSKKSKSVRLQDFEESESLIDNSGPKPEDPYFSIPIDSYAGQYEIPERVSPTRAEVEDKNDGDLGIIRSKTAPEMLNTISEKAELGAEEPENALDMISSDSEFDWNADPNEEEKPKRRRTTREKIKSVMQRPCCWHYLSPFSKRFVIGFSGSCLFVGVAMLAHFLLPYPTAEQEAAPGFLNVRNNVQCWMYWSAVMWIIGWFTTIFVEAIPSVASMWAKVFMGRRSEMLKSQLEYYMSMKKYLKILLIAAWNWGCWAILLQVFFQSVQKQAYTDVIWRVFASIFFVTLYLFIQKGIVQIIAIKFHKVAYNERLKENRYALKILDRLSKAERRSRPNVPNPTSQSGMRNRRPGYSRHSSYDPASLTDDAHNYSYSDRDTPTKRSSGSTPVVFSQLQKKLQNIVLTDTPDARSRIQNSKVDINSEEFAKKVARKLFTSLGNSKKRLTLADFEPYFATLEEAENAFAVFDKDGNHDLSRREMRDTVLAIYKERKALAQSVRDTSQALGKVDAMLLMVSIIATIFTTLTIFNVDIWKSLVPFGSALVALAFVFGNTAKNTFESILFLFVTHPYDAGDYVIIDTETLLVANMGIMSTTFIRSDGQEINAPTTVLMTKFIHNIRRSGNMGESIYIDVHFNTPTEKLLELSNRLQDFLAANSRDFQPGFNIKINEIVQLNSLNLLLYLEHKGNWQDGGKRLERRTRFMYALKDALQDLNIRYSLPTQNITTSEATETINAETPQSFSYDLPRPRHRRATTDTSFPDSAS
ncbi:Mechanosensitive ion channel-domain-containing protein [Umbelopsis sp. PMI_123]|nr:Mechanosensitive ion channel-domain-containing protein [Umbelopsis sp. PMI_123]